MSVLIIINICHSLSTRYIAITLNLWFLKVVHFCLYSCSLKHDLMASSDSHIKCTLEVHAQSYTNEFAPKYKKLIRSCLGELTFFSFLFFPCFLYNCLLDLCNDCLILFNKNWKIKKKKYFFAVFIYAKRIIRQTRRNKNKTSKCWTWKPSPVSKCEHTSHESYFRMFAAKYFFLCC